jgi:cyclophilin family peptidyl-prolyl cis-trans isomerase
MKSFLKLTLLTLLIVSIWGCKKQTKLLNSEKDIREKIEITTNYGSMVIELYNETPLHRDNIIKLLNNRAYDSLLFHRVVYKFMIQGGDPDSKNAKAGSRLGDGDAPYTVKSEFNDKLYHKKGALAAARDDNPEKASSAMQFYIVHGTKFNDSLLKIQEKGINRNKAREYFKNNNSKKSLLDAIQLASEQDNMKHYNYLMDSIMRLANKEEYFKPYIISKKQREVYKSIGGAPFLDQNYTVFGEVVKGIEILDAIAGVKTNSSDRPVKDVRIQTIKLMDYLEVEP